MIGSGVSTNPIHLLDLTLNRPLSHVSGFSYTCSNNSSTIDAAAYPHILDQIILFSPYAALIALRGACRDLRRRADEQLLKRHVVVSCGATGAPWQIRLPVFRDWNGGAIKLECDVVDLVGITASSLLQRSPKIPTLRFMYNTKGDRDIKMGSVPNSAMWLEVPIDTFVVFAPLPYILRNTLPRPARRPLRRVVRNISLHPDDEFEGHPNACIDKLNLLEESVWVFHLAKDPVRAASPWSGEKQRMGLGAMLRRTFDCVREEVAAGARVVVVGLDSVPPFIVKKFERSAFKLLAKVIGRDADKVEQLTFPEYRARVGLERAHLEMEVSR
ncbi:hypothetical protein CC85DRAFT_302088 [Cutaneotrichosporon oleaginosum]|uniref:Uncharacterized protein n=1 Tax=Cutaneotrichosporon oleaginosum TaxID=879819 RepID=A0A0J1B4Z4_9TREE|nr:uncharacterized protein CC85DRAFT_302088 [Cutaneotrichosporon oleaginosum]KLT42764.1 hypothetical protein CC85DRAFT_302088 [Cutaneotrichosporon oleaginosum]TXT09518.1 hypothetical protein COLE_03452 [Cutaneotrichosporon oleaginosum]